MDQDMNERPFISRHISGFIFRNDQALGLKPFLIQSVFQINSRNAVCIRVADKNDMLTVFLLHNPITDQPLVYR